MRRFITLFAFMAIVLTSYAQESSEYLSIKGVPIKGNMVEFCQKLLAKGLTYHGSENNAVLFKGEFTGRNASIGVLSTDDGQNIVAVLVFFDPSGEWNSLVSTYNYCKDLYTRKYGNPSVLKEVNPAYSNYNTDLMAEVYQGTVVWACLWETTGGEIEVSIEKSDGIYEGMVMICYRITQNEKAKIQNDLGDI
jgi:hypothetical protein